jgi:hypothetical protein
LLCLLQTNILSGGKTPLELSISIQSGAYIDITGNFKNGYNLGSGIALKTSKHFEVFTEVNLNFTKDDFDNRQFVLDDYSLGARVYIGRHKMHVMPFIEFAAGLYPDFRDFGSYTRKKAGLNFGAGTNINISKSIDILVKGKMHFPVVTGGHPGGGFYVYSGIYLGVKYRL